MPDRITAWSFSRWDLYEKCARRAYYKFIRKLPDPIEPGGPMERGGLVHKMAENYVLKKINAVPPELKPVAPMLKELRKVKASPELELAVDKNWKPVEWYAPNAWGRAKIDSAVMFDDGGLDIVDWKTGQYKPDDPNYDLQLELYGTFGFATHDEAQRVHAKLAFTDHGKIVDDTFHRKDYHKLKTLWEKRIKRMMTDERFEPSPGRQCLWCPYSKAKGGECEY